MKVTKQPSLSPSVKAKRAPVAAASAPAAEQRTEAIEDAPDRPSKKARDVVGQGAPTALPLTEQGAAKSRRTAGESVLASRGGASDAHQLAALLPKMLRDLGGVDDLKDLGVRPLVASAGEESIYNRLFGRDSIRMAIDLLDSHPKVARATIIELARLQGTKTNPRAEEEPGRILHEVREGEEAKELPWDFPYYGSVDATALWVGLIGAYVKKSGPAVLDEVVATSGPTAGRTVRESLAAGVAWIEKRLDDPRGGGFLWVQRANPEGIENQILEDSHDSVYDEHGKIADPKLPYAPVAEQGYAWRALVEGAAVLAATDPSRAQALVKRADAFKAKFIEAFWQPDIRTFAQAVGFDAEGNGRPFRTVASSPGQLLGSGILHDQHKIRDTMIDRLFQPDMLAGAGIRTKSTTAARFIEGGYHNGTVWPTISLEIKDGLLRCAAESETDAATLRAKGDEPGALAAERRAEGYMAKAIDLEDRALRSCAQFPWFPEFFRGGVDGKIAINTEWVKKLVDGKMNTLEQPPQPQGWTATGIERILRRRNVPLVDTKAPATVAHANAAKADA